MMTNEGVEDRAEAGAAKAKKEAEKAAALEGLLSWAAKHGGPATREAIRMNVGNLRKLASRDWFAAHCPEGYSEKAWRASDKCAPRETPTLEELAELQALRDLVAASGGALEDPGLQYHTITGGYDEDGEYSPDRHYVAADVDIVAPTGETLTVAKRIGDEWDEE